ncbi:TonB-dependent receptor domain-containing protein [Kordiimonas sp. SCSIO 12610]|uniref:TonB-dependent receptor domain-containing protein n=1 Tax=Kordiimonas sp. SCSIO 12610 TaxID=2829597 RepID=UPI00210CF85C|nr:TonB-dependent receptor [Kordiimonas sp. SCSIO 12610]UTW56309.1 TonB-dependent receptor [Kordiimonas sp. SCSIO 12610]
MLGAVSTATLAQDDAATDDDVEEVVVTGTRLNVNKNLTAAAPVLTVSKDEINIRGNTRIEDFVNILPQVFAGQAGEVSNGASGTATLNLRGLGAQRTLVLIDGKRLPYGTSTVATPNLVAPNLDIIPPQLIERVDVVTGGKSAVYGSDAVGGVANFILRTDFEGIEFDAQGGFSQNGNGVELFDNVLRAGGQPVPGSSVDGEELNLALTIGANTEDGRGNATIYASYQVNAAITQDNRSISACALGASADPVTSFGGFGCVGSGNFRLFGGAGGTAFQEADGTITDPPFSGTPSNTFNFGPFNFFQRPSERFQIYARGHYDLTETLTAYADFSFTNNSSDAQIAPTASFGTGAFSINCDNPLIQGGSGPDGTGTSLFNLFGCNIPDADTGLLPGDVSGITASHRNVEGGPRNSFLNNTAWRLVGGLRGQFADNWDFEVFGQFARANDESAQTNDFITSNVQQAFFIVEDADGNLVCRDQSGGCVPYNIFQRGANGESLVTQEALDFIQGIGLTRGMTEQIVVGGNVQTNLSEYGIQSPWSDANVGLLLGVEYREDILESVPDQISQTPGGGFTGVGGATLPVSGSIDVTEFFGELQIPIITDADFFKELTVSGEYRYSDYGTNGNGASNSFNTDAYGVSLTWAPVDDVRFRAQYQRAVRAPNVIELFVGQNQGLANLNQAGVNANGVGVFDPCATDAPIATAAQCANTGVTAAQFGNILDVISGQTQVLTGGNPDLSPEVSDTYTVGVVITPEAVPGLTISVDYFNISVDEAISQGIGAQVILDNCLASGEAQFCDLVQRSPTGSLASGGPGFGFTTTNLNIAELTTSGIDFQVNYSFDLADIGAGDIGQLRFDYAATYLDTFDFTPFPGGDVIECAGFFGNACGNNLQPVNPDYRHVLQTSWDTPWDFSTTVTWRYFAGTDNQSATAPAVDQRLRTINYVDWAGNYSINENINLRAGILNVFNSQAPVSLSSGPPLGNGNTFPTVFDTGRQFFLAVNFSL